MAAVIESARATTLSAVELAAVNKPTGTARGLPNRAYLSTDFAALERDTVFANNWTCVGFASDLPTPGFAAPVTLAGMPLLLVRESDERINVFHNVCSHRGQHLVAEACQFKGSLRCPYHSWSYGFDGSLRGTPHIGGAGVHEVAGFDRTQYGLRRIRSEVWLGLIFVNLSGTAPAFEDRIGPLLERWTPFYGNRGLDNLHCAAGDVELRFEVQANWKLAVENYCESYHLPWVHPGLNSYSRLEDHYNILDDGEFAGQGSYVYNFAQAAGIQLPEFGDWPRDRAKHAEYVALYPNVLLGLQIDHVYAILLMPVAHDRTLERVQIHYVGADAVSEAFASARSTLVEGWRSVFAEDVGVVQGLQRGRHSPAFEGGVFSPVMDVPTHHFHRWVANALASA